MNRGRSHLFTGLSLLAGCSATPMIEMPYLPLPVAEQGSGAVDVIHDLEAPGQLPPLHTVALPEGDVEYRFGVVGHMMLGGTNTIVRVVRVRGKARGEVWCQRLAWELADSAHRMPSQVARTHVEHTPDWEAIIDTIEAIDLMTYRPGERKPIPSPEPRQGEIALVPRDATDQPSLLFEGRQGRRYRSFGMRNSSPEDAVVWARLARASKMVWGAQNWACGELSRPGEPWDPHSTTRWIVRPDSITGH